MSGHSKWSTIKRQKGAADTRRGQAFTKLSNAITHAAKQGGGRGDPDSNFKLRLAVDRARAANMPKENIERAIGRAAGGTGESVSELVYEGFAPSGAALIVEAVTDNKQRTVSSVKNIFDKNGGRLGSLGSVSYLFDRRGLLVAKKNNISSEELLNKGIFAGAIDVEERGDEVFYYVAPDALFQAKKKLEEEGLSIVSAELVFLPKNPLKVEREKIEATLSFIEKLEELDDVQQVYTNLKAQDS